MSDAPIGCTVYIDGVPISDGCSAVSHDAPAVLSGLRIVWGRTSSVDQATASSCSFAIDDPLTGERIVPSLTIGRTVDVHADTVIYPDPDVSTIPVLLPGPTSNVQQVTGAGSTTNVVLAGREYRAANVVYPPRAYSTDPLAWDDVPRTLPGQEWQLEVTVTFPAEFASWHGYAARVQPVVFTDPAVVGSLLPDNVELSPDSPSGVLRFTPPAGVWLGLQVAIYPPGPRWVPDLDGSSWLDLPDPGPSWDDLARFTISGVRMLAPAGGAADSGLVFSGRITDVSVEWNGGTSTRVSVIAQDWLAELANRVVGDQPWAMETINTRAQRIVQLSGQPVTLKVDPGLGALQVSYRDVDRQPAANLLQQLATSGGGILWTATHLVSGQTMWIEDIAARPAALTLTDAGTGLVHIIPSAGATENALPVSACDIEADPVRFILDMSDTSSMISLTWNEQTVNTEGQQQPTQRTVEVIDPAAQTIIGARRLSVSTQLAVATDAQAQAALWLARSSTVAWRVEGLAWDTGLLPALTPEAISTVMTLLDGTRRIGLPIALTDLPEWSLPVVGGHPEVALYVEGGTYEYHAGAWRLELATSSATGSATGVTPWNALDPGWAWTDFDPAVAWIDLYGVTYPDA